MNSEIIKKIGHNNSGILYLANLNGQETVVTKKHDKLIPIIDKYMYEQLLSKGIIHSIPDINFTKNKKNLIVKNKLEGYSNIYNAENSNGDFLLVKKVGNKFTKIIDVDIYYELYDKKLINKLPSKLQNKRLINQKLVIKELGYICLKKIGAGSYGVVNLAENENKEKVAIKVESRNAKTRIINEYKIYKYLQKNGLSKVIPYIFNFIQTPEYNVMVMQLLGPSLEDVYNYYQRVFKLETVLKLTQLILNCIELLHKAKHIHRDIKPNNFLIGVDNNKKNLYIMDFGLSKKYINNGDHISFRDGHSIIGTPRYASVNMHMGFEPSRRDDLESIGYMLIYFLKDRLPWQNLNLLISANRTETIGQIKMSTSINELCTGLPSCYKQYMEYCRSLSFEEEPDYQYIKGLFIDWCSTNNVIPHLEWTE